MSDADLYIVHTGFGTKQGSTVKNWKKRWFVLLSNGKLRYFVDKGQSTEQGHVNILKDTEIQMTTNAGEFTISVISKERTLIINFDSLEEAESWKNVITQLKQTLPE